MCVCVQGGHTFVCCGCVGGHVCVCTGGTCVCAGGTYVCVGGACVSVSVWRGACVCVCLVWQACPVPTTTMHASHCHVSCMAIERHAFFYM